MKPSVRATAILGLSVGCIALCGAALSAPISIAPKYIYNDPGAGGSYISGNVQTVCERHAQAWSSGGLPGTTCVLWEHDPTKIGYGYPYNWYGERYTIQYGSTQYAFYPTRSYFCDGEGYGGGNSCPIPKPVGDSCDGTCQRLVNNPIDAGTGNKFQRETDYVGTGPFPLRMVRAYNSNVRTTFVDPPPNINDLRVRVNGLWTTYRALFNGWHRPGAMQFGSWRTHYQATIQLSDEYWIKTVTATRPDGSALYFTLQASGVWAPNADVTTRLTRLVDSGGTPTGWQLVGPSGEVEQYDVSGKLLTITHPSGVVQTLTYSTTSTPFAPVANLLIAVTDSFGQSLNFTYDSNRRMTTMTDPSGQVYVYAYDVHNNLLSVTYPDTRVRTYLYNEPQHMAISLVNALTGIVDESGTRFATWKYDSSGRGILSEHAGGADKVTLSYVSSNSSTITNFKDSSSVANLTKTYQFQHVLGAPRVSSIAQPCTSGCTTMTATTSYDANGNATIKRDFNGRETRATYDVARNLETSRTEGYGTPHARTITTQWHATRRLPTQIDEPGKRITFTHDANGNVLTRTETDLATTTSRIWTYTYNSYGQVLTANGPRTDVSDITTYAYYTCTTGYQCGQVATIRNALNQTTTYNTYNAHGQPLTITDPNGVVTTLTYDLRQRLTSRTVGTEVSTFEYWPTGLLKKATLSDGSFIDYTYDAAHRLTGISDSEGNRIAYTLDLMGNRTREDVYDPSNSLTNTRTRVFNTLNRLSQELTAGNISTGFAYDNNGNQTAVNAPLGRNTASQYDELNRLTQVTDPASGVTRYGYNALDQLISVTDPRNKVTSYTYNALGDLIQQVSPDTGATTHTYDAAGNLLTKTDARGVTVTYTYDALNRIASASTPDQLIQYHYDQGANAQGRLSDVTDNSGQTAWTYDAQGRIASRQQTIGGLTKSIAYGYDSAGRLASMTLPSGHAIQYGYTHGKVTSLSLGGTSILSGVLYEPFGPVRGWTWGDSSIAARTFDADGKLTALDSAGPRSYAYDDAFRITGITDVVDANLSQSFGYDLLDRLTSASGSSLNQSFTYDANGNRLTQGGSAASTFSVSTANNRLNSVSGAVSKTYSYDNTGNTLSDGAATFTYDQQGRMGTSLNSGVLTSYAYNALGQRVRKSNASGTTYFVYDEAGHLIGEYDATGALIQEIVWLGDIPVASIRPNENGTGVGVFYIHTDHLNAPTKLTRSTDGAIVWRWDHDPFGNGVPNEDPDGNGLYVAFNLRFPGQYADSETGLYYNYHRTYDPQTGKYLTSDPIGLRGGLNTYAYVGANPVGFIDPLGLDRCSPFVNFIFFEVAICERTPPPPAFKKPADLSPKEQSIWDSTCAGTEDPCKALKAATQTLIAIARGRMEEMLDDANRFNLYRDAYSIPNPEVTGSPTTWQGHVDALDGVIAKIWHSIYLGRKMGCDMSAETAAALTLLTPYRPR